MLGVVYKILRIAIQYQVSRARPGAGIVSAPYEAHVGCLVTSLFIIGWTWPSHIILMTAVLKSTSSVSYVTSSPLWLEWYFHLDITSNTLRFSIYPAEAYTESVKALDDQNQSILIIASISGASLKLRLNTTTLISDFHRQVVILLMEFRGGLSRAKLFSILSVKHNLVLHLHEYPIPKYMRTMPLWSHIITHKCNTSLLHIYRCPISIILWLGIFND